MYVYVNFYVRRHHKDSKKTYVINSHSRWHLAPSEAGLLWLLCDLRSEPRDLGPDPRDLGPDPLRSRTRPPAISNQNPCDLRPDLRDLGPNPPRSESKFRVQLG